MAARLSAARLEAATVERGRRRLLGPISLEVGQGELVGVVGPNGAGKTTLLRLLGGLERPTAGQVETLGERLPAGRRRLRGQVGFLFQEHAFAAELPFQVEDVVAFGRAAHGRLDAGDHQMVDRALGELGLVDQRHRLYRELSGGERQQAQLARLLAQAAPLLLLDEPAAGLDLDWQERMTRLVGELRGLTGATVVMVTHRVNELPAGCDAVLLLKAGQPLALGRPHEVLTPALLSQLYGCAMTVSERGGRFHAAVEPA